MIELEFKSIQFLEVFYRVIQIYIATTLNSKKINPVEMQKLGEFRHKQETSLSNVLEIDLH